MLNNPGTAEFPREVNLTIPMIPNMELAAIQTAEAVARFMEFDDDLIGDVKMAIVEACINAFEHSRSVDGNVYIKFMMQAEELTVIIQDFGSGFDAAEVPIPDIHAKVAGEDERKRGWGLKLMESLMDSVQIAAGPGGTKITMSKLRQRGEKS